MNSLTGTPMYMSPEVIKGEKQGSPCAMDIWSLGCVILEMATGRRPWQSDNEWAVMFQIGVATKHPPLPDPSQLSPAGIDFVRRCLEINPEERPSAEELLEHEWLRSLVADIGYENQKYEEEMALAAQAAVSTEIGFVRLFLIPCQDVASRANNEDIVSPSGDFDVQSPGIE